MAKLIVLALCLSWFQKITRAYSDEFSLAREKMVAEQIAGRDVKDPSVLRGMRKVPRHLFVPKEKRLLAYEDHALPIGEDQTISQPYIVAKMTELARVSPGDKVLEIGTGSGYQAALLAEIGAKVYSIEIIQSLSDFAAQNLKTTGYKAHLKVGDGYRGWPKEAPFDAIIVTAAPEKIPQPLIDQLKIGGRMVIPVGTHAGPFSEQNLKVIEKTKTGIKETSVFPVLFVPMTGESQKK